MKEKRLFVVVFLITFVFFVNACTLEERHIIYKDREMPISEAEERIADELEVENPDLDIDISIYHELD